MAEQDDHVGAMLDAFAEHLVMEDIAAYLRRGRLYATLTDDALAELWVFSFRAWLPDRTDEAALTRSNDAEAELHLRGAGPPFGAVRTEMEAARGQMRYEKEVDDIGLRDKLRAFIKSANDRPN